LMTADEVGLVARQGIDIELHTHRHRTPRDRTAFDYEISENSRIIASAAGRVPEHFCYPSGDYDLQFLEWLTAAGVKSGTTCEVGLAGPNHHPLLLPRFIDTMGQSPWAFRAWLSGAAEFLATSRPISLAPTSGRNGLAS
jgi:peptidoglycan/xylan/chitin deacetylase (PgdA/CDA1 family)